MPLTFIDGHHRYDEPTGTVVFVAEDQTGRRINCAVSQEGLADLERLTMMGPEVVEIYVANAALIQSIAQEKFDRKRIRADGVVVITSGDLLPYG